jgi:hypothetical protein
MVRFIVVPSLRLLIGLRYQIFQPLVNRCARYLLLVLKLAMIASLYAQEPRLIRTIPLPGDTFHVQGVDLDKTRLWVTSVDKERKRGLLLEYRLDDEKLLRSLEIQQGDRYHPGGLMADSESLWIPIAEYKRNSSAIIQRRNKRTLQVISQFNAPDHIGAVAVTRGIVIGANWDAREFYIWDRNGKLLRKVANSSGLAIQDMKFVNGSLVGGGLNSDKSGAIVWMQWPSLKVIRTLPMGSTDRGIAYTHEGMAIRNSKLWLLPEDAPSRLFTFTMP